MFAIRCNRFIDTKTAARRSARLHLLFAAAAAASALVAASPVCGQNATWIGPLAGDWGIAANWSNNTVPSSSTDVRIDATAGNVTVNTNVNQSFNANNLTIDIGDALQIDNNSSMNLAGNLINNGSLRFNANPSQSFLRFNSATATITGTGVIEFNYLTGSPVDGRIAGTGFVTNQSTIRGHGTIANIRFDNAIGGLLEANQTNGAQFYWDAWNGGIDSKNLGIVRASSGGLFTFSGDNGGNVDSTGGSIQANGAGSIVRLVNGINVKGGNYSTTGGGEIVVDANQTVSASPESLSGTFRIRNASRVNWSGTTTNNGTIFFSPAGNENFLTVNGNVTFNGTGAFQMDWPGSGGAGVFDGTGTLNLGANQTVRGVGSFRNLRVNNNGLIDANDGTSALLGGGMFVDPNNASPGLFVNNGTLRSSNGGLLILSGDNGGDVINNGTIGAIGNNSVTRLYNSISITGGTFSTTGSGLIRVNDGQHATIGGTTTLTTGSTIQVPTSSTLHLSGSVTNNGTVQLATTNASAVLDVPAPLTMSGTGAITGVYGGTGAGPRIDGGSNMITIGAGNTVNGVVHFNNVRLTNNGLIDANQAAGMYVDASNQVGGPYFFNNGTMRSSNGGLMTLTGDNGGEFVNNGTISAIGANSITELYNTASVTGGTWTSSGGGVLRIRPGQSASVVNAAIPAGSKFDVPATASQTTLNASGAYALDGTLDLIANGSSPVLNTTAPLAFSGNGTLRGSYSGAGNGPRIDGNTSMITIGAGNTVSGVIHFNNVRLTNNGLIDANDVAGMYTDASNQAGGPYFFNNGTMRSSSGGLMVLTGDNNGDFINNGTISAIGANSITELYNNATVSGGTWTNSGGGVLRVRPGQQANVLNPTIPAGSKFDLPATSSQTTLQASGNYTVNGTLELNSNGATALMALPAPVTLSGSGTLRGTYSGAGPGPRVDAFNVLTIGAGNTVGGVIFFNNSRVTNNGVMLADQPVGGMAVDASNAVGGPHFINNGTMRATNGATLTLMGDNGGAFSGLGPLVSDAASTIQAQNSATGVMGPVSGAGNYNVVSGSNMTHTHVRVGTASIGDNSTLTIASNSTDAAASRLKFLSNTVNASRLDLTDNDLLMDGTGGMTYAQVSAKIASGRNGGAWNGNGIISGAARTQTDHATSLGAITGTQFKSVYGGAAPFDGFAVANADVLVKYTWYGDTDFNGKVDGADYARIDTNFNNQAVVGNISGWFNGDLDYNSKVDGADYALIDAAFNAQNAVLRGGMLPVPEPALTGVAAFAAVCLGRRRRR